MKKLKGILLTVVTVILAVAMLVGTATVSVFADNTNARENVPAYGASKEATLVRKVNYGDDASKISGAQEIIAPSGENILGKKFNEIGAYTVKFANGYSYVVSCTLDKDYELRVAHNGADIPTYLQAGGTFTLPAAAMWYKSENEYIDYEKEIDAKIATVYCEIEGATVKYKGNAHTGDIIVSGDYNPEKDGADKYEITLPNAQTYTVHYYCKVNGGSKYIFKDYTVNVQKKFEDKSAPSLGLVNVPQNISLNTKVTLPKATATDNYDKNVKVEITVEEFDKDQNKYVPVKHVEPDEDGYGIAYSDEEYAKLEDEVFENDYNLSFYPIHATKYLITYSAVDDSGNRVVSDHVYDPTASDRTAPVLKNIDEDKIPTVWGLSKVSRAIKGNETGTSTDLTEAEKLLKFPTPEFVDNSRETPKVKFELRDTVNNNVVISFENINDKEGDGAKYKYSSSKPSAGLYPTEGENGITWASLVNDGLDLTKYTELDSMKGKTVTGKYTVRYEARDSVPHTTSRTYNIDIQDEFSDTKAPLINDVKFDDKFIVFTNEETDFNIPVLEVSDDNDAKPTVEYKLYAADVNGAAKTGDNSEITVEGGETAKLELIDNVPTLTVDDDKVIKFNDTYKYLVYSIVATDDVGNEATLSNKKEGVAFKKEDLIAVVDGSKLAAPTLEFNGNGVVTTPSEPSTRATGFVAEMKEGVRTTVGGFAVTPNTSNEADKNREFYGFEISLYTVKDKNATNGDQTPELWTAGEVTLKTYWDDKNKVLHVDDITFAAPRVDQVIVFVRAYSVSGASTIAGKTINVTKKDSSGGTTSAIDWRNEGTVYTEYTIKNRELQTPEDIDLNQNYIVREIVGNGKFALTGFRFSAYNAGSFTFSEYYNKKDNGGLVLFNNGAKDTIVISETATPVWNLQDKMPTYVKLSTATEKNVVALPKLVASTEYANAKVELTATFKPAGSDTKVLTVAKTKDETGKDISINDDGQYIFEPKSDGTYTFKYSAFYGDNGSVDVEYVVKAGDVTPPDFDVQGKHATTATENDTFEFHAIKLGENEDGESKMTFTKTLKDPAGTAVYTVKGTGPSYASATKPTDGSKYTFTKTGNYTVEYSVKDQAGNETLYTETITVSAANVSSPISTKIISTILIIVGVLLIAGVILYFVRFRKVKSK